MDTRKPPGRSGLARPIERRAVSPAFPLVKIPGCLGRMPRGADGGGRGRRTLETMTAFPKDRQRLMPGRALGHRERVAALPEPPCRPPIMMDFLVMPTDCSGTSRTKTTTGADVLPCWTGPPCPDGRPPPAFFARWRSPNGMAAVTRLRLGFGYARRAGRSAQGRERPAWTRGGGEYGPAVGTGQPARPLGGHGGGANAPARDIRPGGVH